MTKALKSHYLLALQLPQHSPLVLRGHRIAEIVLAWDPCPLEALSCEHKNKQLKMLFNSGFSSNVISPTKVDRGQKASQHSILESSRDDDGDGNGDENVRTAIGLDWQNNNFAHASRCFLYFFAVTARLRRETALTFCGGRKHMITTFFFFSIQSFRIQLQKKLPTFDELNEME